MASAREIKIPRRLVTVSSVLNLGLSKADLANVDECNLYFSGCEFAEPLPMLLLGREIRALSRNNPGKKVTIWTKDTAFRNYADHVGFFRYAGIPRGNRNGEAFGSPNYIPIQVIDLEQMREDSGERPYAELVEEKSENMARVLVQQSSGDLYKVIQYSLREIIRNSVEHSRGKALAIFAQYWPKLQKSEITIFDNGIGIEQTLREGGIIEESSASDAILLALEPGVTGVTKLVRDAQHEHYRNSGFGMYVTSRFCSERGYFRVMSGEATITRNKSGDTITDWPFQGTCVQMVLDTSNMHGAAERVLEIVKEGEEKLGLKSSASSSSKSLII